MKSWGKRLVGVFFGGKGAGARKAARPVRTRRVGVEALEERQMLSAVQAVDLGINGSSDAVVLGEFNGEIYLRADDGILGAELWKMDASGEVSLVADIAEGAESSDPSDFLAAGQDIAYFRANDGIHGSELWGIDAEGNVSLVADIREGDYYGTAYSSYPRDLIVVEDGTLFFTAADGVHGRELWRLDDSGTASLVADLNEGEGDVNIRYLTTYGNGIYFALVEVNDIGFDSQSDLTYVDASGEVSTLDFDWVRGIEVFNDELYIGGRKTSVDHGLWKGDVSGEITCVWSGYSATKLSATEDYLYFSSGMYAISRLDSSGQVDAFAPDVSWIESFSNLTPFNDDLYFVGQPDDPYPEDSDVPSERLYCCNGNNVAQVTSGPVDNLTVTSGVLYFTATDEDTGNQAVYRIGDDGEVVQVTDQESGSLWTDGDVVYFPSEDETHGNELWMVDASGEASLAADINLFGEADPNHLVVFNESLYFLAYNKAWQLDSSGNLTCLENLGVAYVDNLIEFNGDLYYQGKVAVGVPVIGRITSGGEASIIYDGISLSAIGLDPIVFNDALYFVADYRLWKLDASGSVTEMAKAYTPRASYYTMRMAVFDNHLYFVGLDEQLWRLDAAGNATLVAEEEVSLRTMGLTVLGDYLYYPTTHGFRKVDAEGNVSYANSDTPLGELIPLAEFNGELYFSFNHDDGIYGAELWKYDTDGNFVRVTDINPAGDSSPSDMYIAGDFAYFVADDGTNGEALWVLDTAGNVSMVADLMPGNVYSPDFSDFAVYQNELYFAASAGYDYRQLWKLVDADLEELGVVDYREVADQSLAAGERFYGLSTTRAGLLSIEVNAASAEEAVNVTLYNASGAIIETAQLVEGKARFDYEAETAGEAFQLLITGTNTSVDLRLCNLVAQSGATVSVYDTTGTDAYLFAITDTFDVTANGVEYTFDDATEFNFTSTAGDDTVEMVDSDGDDTLTVSPTEMAMTGTTGGGVTYSVSAEGFRYSHAYARVGGNDTAYFVGSEQTERMKAYEGLVKLMGGQYYARAKFFESVEVAMGEGDDTAVVVASDGADVLWAMKEALKVSHNVSLAEGEGPDFDGMSYDVTVTGCESIVARGSGSDDWVQLHDSAVNDVFIAKPHKLQMMNAPRTEDDVARGEEYTITVRGYTNVSAVADQGGDSDVAKLYDSSESGTDTWSADYVDGQTWSAMTSPSRLLYEVLAFEQVGGYGFNGGLGENHGTNQRDHGDDVDFVFEYGYWEDASTTSRPVEGSWWNGRESL